MPDASAYPTAAHTPESGIGHDHVGLDRRLARQPAAEVGAHLVDALAEHVAVGTREIDVLEHALRRGRRRIRLHRLQAVPAGDDDLARLDVAHVGGADQVERARLGADHPRVAEPANGQRPEAVRIARADHLVLRHHDERERAAHLGDRVDDGRLGAIFPRPGEQVDDDLGVAVRLEDGALPDQLRPSARRHSRDCRCGRSRTARACCRRRSAARWTPCSRPRSSSARGRRPGDQAAPRALRHRTRR